MNQEVCVLDVVALTQDIPEESLLRGRVGTVVISLGPDTFEVKFMDNDSRTYATFP